MTRAQQADKTGEAYATLLSGLARHHRFHANIPTPRDYVPTAEELAIEAAPGLILADALDAGAQALRSQTDQGTCATCQYAHHAPLPAPPTGEGR